MKTLLENLCEVFGQQGGTIHQFLDTQDPLFNRFEREYKAYIETGFTFSTKKGFKKLADRVHIELKGL